MYDDRLAKLVSEFKSLDLSAMRPIGFLEKVHQVISDKVDHIAESQGWVAVNSCPLCRSSRSDVEFVAYGFDMRRCDFCRLRFFSHQPKDLKDVYAGQQYLSRAKSNYLLNVDYRIKRFARERLNLIKSFLPFVPGQCILDVGCGTGWFLDAARSDGYEVVGQEFAKTGYRKFNRPFLRVWRVGSGRASAALGTDRAQIGGSCVGFRHRGATQRLSA